MKKFHHHHHTGNKQTQKGFSLLEVLITLAIVVLGCLAIVSMLLVSLRYKQTSQYRFVAISQANFIVDKMNANAEARNKYITKETAYENATPEMNDLAAYKVACTEKGGACTADDIAINDLHLWFNTLDKEMPGGRGSIEKIDNTSSQYKVTVMWMGKQEDSKIDEDTNITQKPDPECPAGTEFGISCFSIRVAL